MGLKEREENGLPLFWNMTEIKPTKLIKGQGLAKLMAESNCQALDINFIGSLDDQEEMVTPLGKTNLFFRNILQVQI